MEILAENSRGKKQEGGILLARLRQLWRHGGPAGYHSKRLRPLLFSLLLQLNLPSAALEAKGRWAQAYLRHTRGAAAGSRTARGRYTRPGIWGEGI